MFMAGRYSKNCGPTDTCFGCFALWTLILIGCSVALYWLTHAHIREECVVMQMENCSYVTETGSDRIHPYFAYDILVQPAECEVMKILHYTIGGLDFTKSYNGNCSLYFDQQIYPNRTIQCYWMEYDSPCDVVGLPPPIKSKAKGEPDDFRQITWCIVIMVISFIFAITCLVSVILRECSGHGGTIGDLCHCNKRNTYRQIN